MPRSVSQSSNAPGQWPSNSFCQGRPPSRASPSRQLGGNVAAHEDELERAVEIDDERRLEALDQRDQRLGLRLGAGVRSRRGAVRPVREDPQLGIDPRRKGEGRVRLPGRRREVAVEVDAGRVLPGSGEQAVRVEHGDHRPARLGAAESAPAAGARAARCPLPRRAGRPSAGRRPHRRPPAGRPATAGRRRERPYSSTRQPSSSLPSRSLTGRRSGRRPRASPRRFP